MHLEILSAEWWSLLSLQHFSMLKVEYISIIFIFPLNIQHANYMSMVKINDGDQIKYMH